MKTFEELVELWGTKTETAKTSSLSADKISTGEVGMSWPPLYPKESLGYANLNPLEDPNNRTEKVEVNAFMLNSNIVFKLYFPEGGADFGRFFPVTVNIRIEQARDLYTRLEDELAKVVELNNG